MTFSYGGDPSNDLVDAVRFRVADTNPDSPLFEDEEILFELTEADNDSLRAALACAEVLVARASQKITKKIGQMQISYSDLTDQSLKLVDVLQAKVQRNDMSFIVPKIGKTADSKNYPLLFEPNDVTGPNWNRRERPR